MKNFLVLTSTGRVEHPRGTSCSTHHMRGTTCGTRVPGLTAPWSYYVEQHVEQAVPRVEQLWNNTVPHAYEVWNCVPRLMTTMEHEGEKVVFHEEQHCSTPQATCSTRAHGVEHCCSSLWNIAFHTTYHLWNIIILIVPGLIALSHHSITHVEHTTFGVEQGQMHGEHLLAHVWNTLWNTCGTLSLFSRV